jgi:hypothetical protein
VTRRAVAAAATSLVLAAATAVALVLAATLTLEPAPVARAADPGRWIETGRAPIPLEYYQGITSDPSGRRFFDGVGLHRTDGHMSETARRTEAVPARVRAREGYDHVGDITWNAREGGRILLPLECYYAGTCRTGAIGVADADTLEWRYYVKLDPAEVRKAMWAEVSPDGELLWTQSGDDLLAYNVDDVTERNAHPGAPPIEAVRRLPGAVPPSGITGAAFHRGRLFVAGQDDPDGLQVWSIDLGTGAGRLEIERRIAGESEGIDFSGGTLQWMILPPSPTFTGGSGTILRFVPRR